MAGPVKAPVEDIKAASNFLRGTVKEGLEDAATGALSPEDTQLTKFHGIYQQDDRDLREERRRRLLEPDHQFMIRARVPGGLCTPQQWLALDDIATRYANHSLRLTTRQAFQFHGVLKRSLKPSIRAINDALLDTLAACGDVNRNVMCTALSPWARVHEGVVRDATQVSAHLTPRTSAYHEIWLDGERVEGGDEEPVYGATYLPRKFKMAFAIPPWNDVDVLAHDLGFIAIVEDGELIGYNVTVGGGMGATHGDPSTYPRLADVLGYCLPGEVRTLSEAVVKIQRDSGDRSNRRHARFKYTVEDHGLDWLRSEIESRSGIRLQPARPFRFEGNGDAFGWHRTDDGLWHVVLFIQNGRIEDRPHARQLTGLRRIAEVHAGHFRLTPNQNLIIANVSEPAREAIEPMLAEFGLDAHERLSAMRLNAMACVALPTCGLAMAEAERYLPEFSQRLGDLMELHGLASEPINLRMTGCPNGCARPYLGEIGLVGKAPGRYNLHLGAAHDGTELNLRVAENLDESAILSTLDEWLGRFASGRQPGERFGAFVRRSDPDIRGTP